MGMSLKSQVYLALQRTHILTMTVSRHRGLFDLDDLIGWDKPKSELWGCCGVLQHINVHQRRGGFEGAGLRGELLLSFCSCCQLCTAVIGIQL